jgi:hypothetical protein
MYLCDDIACRNKNKDFATGEQMYCLLAQELEKNISKLKSIRAMAHLFGTIVHQKLSNKL